jgi:hypothetical protein
MRMLERLDPFREERAAPGLELELGATGFGTRVGATAAGTIR